MPALFFRIISGEWFKITRMALAIRGQMCYRIHKLKLCLSRIMLQYEQNHLTRLRKFIWMLQLAIDSLIGTIKGSPRRTSSLFVGIQTRDMSHQSVQISDVLLWKKVIKANLINSGLSSYVKQWGDTTTTNPSKMKMMWCRNDLQSF